MKTEFSTLLLSNRIHCLVKQQRKPVEEQNFGKIAIFG